jgi:hypothetical protein
MGHCIGLDAKILRPYKKLNIEETYIMIQEFQLRVLPEKTANEQTLKEHIAHEKGLDIRTINALRILKRSIDARQRTIFINLTVRLYINELPHDDEFQRTVYPNVEGRPQVVVVGAASSNWVCAPS